jgi:hypothetical protein
MQTMMIAQIGALVLQIDEPGQNVIVIATTIKMNGTTIADMFFCINTRAVSHWKIYESLDCCYNI